MEFSSFRKPRSLILHPSPLQAQNTSQFFILDPISVNLIHEVIQMKLCVLQ